MRCNRCHGDSGTEQNLITRTYADLMAGDVIVPGEPDRSRVVEFIEGRRGPEHRMPLGGPPLSPEQIGIIRRWIAEGSKLDPDKTPKYRIMIPKIRARRSDPLQISSSVPKPAYLILQVRDSTRVLIERRASGREASWTIWPENGWPASVAIELNILYSAAEPEGAVITVNSAGQSRSEIYSNR
jgi:hypothetical protein